MTFWRRIRRDKAPVVDNAAVAKFYGRSTVTILPTVVAEIEGKVLVNLQVIIPIVLQVSVFLTAFAIGLKATLQDVTYVFRRPGDLVRKILAIYVLLPLFVVGLVFMLDLHQAVKVALVALALSPIPPLLPTKMMKAGANWPYAIGVLMAAAALSIIFVPISIAILGWAFDLPLKMSAWSVAVLIFTSVQLPIFLGVAVNRFAPRLADRIAKPISQIAGAALLACVAAILIAAAPAIWALFGNGTFAVFVAFVLAGLAIGHFLGGPTFRNRGALAIATSSRHPGIAIAIAQANYPDQKPAIAAILLFLLINAVFTIPYIFWFKRRRLELE